MDDILHAEATDDDTVRVRVDGEITTIGTKTARQLRRDLDAALHKLGVERQTPAEKVQAQRFEEVEYVGGTLADRLSERYETVEEAASASMSELMLIDGVGKECAQRIQEAKGK